jgi:hypothetical protein
MTPNDFFSAVQAYCYAAGGSVTSWGRTPKHNKAVGGVDDSAHLLWTGADVVYDGGMEADPLRDRLAARLGLMLVHEGDHDHIQPAR